ncbi:DUF721 domain-containing protein [Pseudoxanthomonas dokdonensis]|uniref:DUF721 domain-containing protein n=1 Tax=Pseudoxanthomonas dokdonensis TaxID=344882 RepID=UPI0009FB6D5A|nr:DUF721 domain-containing protein [Pseudoxanthomonas dokdonensis]
MSDSKSKPRRAGIPRMALEAAMTPAASDPVRRAMWLDALEQQLRPCIPPALSPHCRLANVAGERIVFLVDSPVWKAKLRLAAPELLNAARSIGLTVTEVTVKITTAPLQAGRPARSTEKPVSEVARKALAAALASLTQPPSLDRGTTPGSHRDGEEDNP